MKKHALVIIALLTLEMAVMAQGVPQSKETYTVNGVSFKMVRVEGGAFKMGATEDQAEMIFPKPVRDVTVNSFSIGETEVTQELWEAVMGDNPSDQKEKDCPVVNVSWYDCQKFIKKLSKLTGLRFRLPTEEEWEYAARGGKKDRPTRYAGSNHADEVAWRAQNSGTRHLSEDCTFEDMRGNYCKLHPVATKLPNELRIYDMTGNVSEWTSSKSTSEKNKYIVKGGNYLDRRIRFIADNGVMSPKECNFALGVRLVLSE